MPIENTNPMDLRKPDAETMLENDDQRNGDLMREYANQLNGEIENTEDLLSRED
ncbi:hypothetical protein LJK88_45730 [Paenibacillus sp. P26]|nr:hypothetical protein LJK88_45730 [Paenibacillus sp. P26]UUZ92073.1 hypothetical protein LJK87_42635 [Paenibacillus sp. P25]